jgi:hypothetical protein
VRRDVAVVEETADAGVALGADAKEASQVVGSSRGASATEIWRTLDGVVCTAEALGALKTV